MCIIGLLTTLKTTLIQPILMERYLSQASINASVFQGSAVGPAMFVVNGSDLKPITTDNYIDKYADDTYLIVPSGNEESCISELTNIESWAQANNLTLTI